MSRFSFFQLHAAWLTVAGLLIGPAHAQSPAAPAAAAQPPADALTYRSALADYQPHQAQPVRPWRETNDEVGRIGGWRAYAREAAQAAPADAARDLGAVGTSGISGTAGVAGDKPAPETGLSSAPLSAPPPAVDPHAGHHRGKP